MAATYEKIASVTVGSGGAADIEFTNIANTWDDLVLKCSLRSTFSGVNDNVLITFNNVGSGYSERLLLGTGSAANSFSRSGNEFAYLYTNGANATSSTFANGEVYIPNYKGSTNKSISIDAVTENNATAANQALDAGLWSNTAAITSIKLNANGANFVQYSTAVLYGIKKS